MTTATIRGPKVSSNIIRMGFYADNIWIVI